jgi:hypothetical protein
MKTTRVHRSNLILRSDPTRVLLRPFLSATDPRAARICAQVLALPESRVRTLWAQVLEEFGRRHPEIEEFLMRRFELVRGHLRDGRRISNERKLLLGSYFSHEYSLEAAALFNPSIVPHPDQSDLPKGSLRFILSLRATGEGHISSDHVPHRHAGRRPTTSTPPTRHFCIEPEQTQNAAYDKTLFEQKLHELGLAGDFTRRTLFADLPDTFTLAELRESGIEVARAQLTARKQQAPTSRPRSCCSRNPTTRSTSPPTPISPSASSSPPRPRRATASRTPASSVPRRRRHASPTTPPTPPTTADDPAAVHRDPDFLTSASSP